MKRNRGISLIVLVVIIIVMIIIAGVVIQTLTNTNIIDMGEDALKTHNEKSIKEAINLEYQDELITGLGKIDINKLIKRLQDLSKEYPSIQNIRQEEGIIYYTLSFTGKEYAINIYNNSGIQENDPYERVVGEASLWTVSGTRITGYNGVGEQLKNVTIPNVVVDENGNEIIITSVFMINSYFEGTLTIASNLIIEQNSFSSNANLKIEKLIMGDNITIAERSNAFKECPNLKEVEIGNNISIKTHTSYDYIFRDCTSLENITIESVAEAGAYAFYTCKVLKGTIKINEEVTEVADYAFTGCENIEQIVLPTNITTIGIAAFSYCKNAMINYPENITSIGKSGFAGCENIKPDIKIKDGVILGEHAFSRSGIKTLEVGNNILLPYGTFTYCENLEKVIIKNDVQIKDAFAGCDSLKEVVMGKNISIPTSTMYQHPFYNCIALENVTVESLSEIGIKAFYGVSKALNGTVQINEGVTEIGNLAFSGCINLEGITFPSTIANIGNNVLGGCKGLKMLSVNMTEEEFENVTKGTAWNQNVPVEVTYLK